MLSTHILLLGEVKCASYLGKLETSVIHRVRLFSLHLSLLLDTKFIMEILFLLLLFNCSTVKLEKDFLLSFMC